METTNTITNQENNSTKVVEVDFTEEEANTFMRQINCLLKK